MSYTPNMSIKEVADKDENRGRGQHRDDPLDTFPIDDRPKDKRPWDVKTPVNKSEENNMILDLLKGCDKHDKCPPDCDHGEDILVKDSTSKAIELLKSLNKDKDKEGEEANKAPIDAGNWGPKYSSETDRMSTSKALNSRSLYIPKPLGEYDPYGIHRSANAVTSRRYSGLNGPEGVAPLVGETMRQVGENEKKRTVTYKSCLAHGITYREDLGCHPCNIVKATQCNECGWQMNKAYLGYACPGCGNARSSV